MRWSLSVFGREIIVVQRDDTDPTELLAQAIADLQTPPDNEDEEEESEVASRTISGAGSHDFERDPNPLRADEHHRWEWEDKFGFH